MPGVKTFINTTASTLQITLFTRQGDNPANADGTTSFTLTPGQTRTITYGSQQNSFLNGISLTTTSQGEAYTKTQLVTARNSQLDNLLIQIMLYLLFNSYPITFLSEVTVPISQDNRLFSKNIKTFLMSFLLFLACSA